MPRLDPERLVVPEILLKPERRITIPVEYPIYQGTKDLATVFRARGGRMSYGEFMLLSNDKYYKEGTPQILSSTEQKQDFATCAEEPCFGASVAEYAQTVWEGMGKPPQFPLVEMGAGKGTLGYNSLNYARNAAPDFYASLQYHIIEESPYLQTQQEAKLASFVDGQGNPKVQWQIASVFDAEIPQTARFVLSNELCDDLYAEFVMGVPQADGSVKPMQRFIRIDETASDDKRIVFIEELVEPTEEVQRVIEQSGITIRANTEESIPMGAIRLHQKLLNTTGERVVLTIDYGANGPVGQELTQAVRYYGPEDLGETVFGKTTNPGYKYFGQVNPTVDVNFAALNMQVQTFRPDLATLIMAQNEFLRANNLDQIIQSYLKENRTYVNMSNWNDLISYSTLVRVQRSLLKDKGFQAFVIATNPKFLPTPYGGAETLPPVPEIQIQAGIQHAGETLHASIPEMTIDDQRIDHVEVTVDANGNAMVPVDVFQKCFGLFDPTTRHYQRRRFGPAYEYNSPIVEINDTTRPLLIQQAGFSN